MFFVVSKTVWFFTQPSSLITLLIIAGLGLAATRRFARAGLRAAWTGVVLLVVCGIGPVANWLTLPLEERFPRPTRLPEGPIAGIILLGGYEDGRITGARGTLTLNEAGERLTEAALLARRVPAARLVISGGAGSIVREDRAGTADVGAWLEGMGIARERLVLEDRSTTTLENARFTRDLVRPKPGERWLLVTSAAHMPRSIGTFRGQGFDVIAWPADFRTKDAGDALRPFQAIPRGLRRLDDAMQEWIGLAAYRLLGRTGALFPAP